MTIPYQDSFFKLLLRWPGSLWRSIWKDVAVFLSLYYSINAVYRFGMPTERKKHFENFVHLFNDFTRQIPLPFLLGFYVMMVIRRWWAQFELIAYPDHFMFWVSALIRGKVAEGRLIRKTIARYCILSSVLAWRGVSVRVRKRFPTERHVVNSGLMTEKEYLLFQSVKITKDPHGAWFVPLNWILSILTRLLEQNKLTHTNEMRQLIEELDNYRKCFFKLFLYDWVPIPLVYTQVTIMSVYGYFAFCLIGHQYPIHNEHNEIVDLYIPISTILQFLFYVGWLKVGEDLIFPFGSDDEDFELNYILDRNLETAYLIVDDLHQQMPPLYSDNVDKLVSLPHTKGSALLDYHPQVLHLATLQQSDSEMELATKEKFLENQISFLCCRCSKCDNSEDTEKVKAPPPVTWTQIHIPSEALDDEPPPVPPSPPIIKSSPLKKVSGSVDVMMTCEEPEGRSRVVSQSAAQLKGPVAALRSSHLTRSGRPGSFKSGAK